MISSAYFGIAQGLLGVGFCHYALRAVLVIHVWIHRIIWFDTEIAQGLFGVTPLCAPGCKGFGPRQSHL